MSLTRLLAGVDIGNATTEVVLVAADSGAPAAWDRTRTRGAKGSAGSIQAAAALVRRLAARAEGELTGAVVAPLRPVRTATASVPEPPPDTGPFAVLAAGASSPGGIGLGVGRPVLLSDLPGGGSEPVIALVPATVPYREAAARLSALLAAGVPVVGALLAADEGRLVANRLPSGVGLPVVDNVDIDAVRGTVSAVVEVAPAGRPLRRLTDPLFLASAFSAPERDGAFLRRLARRFHDVSSGAAGCAAPDSGWSGLAARGSQTSAVWTDGRHPQVLSLGEAGRAMTELRPGEIVRYALDGSDPVEVADLAVVDVGALVTGLLLRTGASASGYALAALRAGAATVAPDAALAELLGVPVTLAASEAAAARRGALSTPGVPADALVVDLGGGTTDVIDGDVQTVLAGGGDLLTAAAALALGITRGAAEWAKRGPAVRVETPQLVLHEDGEKSFLPGLAPAGALGWLAAPGPAGLLPFSSLLGPAEWRALRLALKRAVLGVAVRRGLGSSVPGTVLVVGGPAGDDEVLRVVDAALPDQVRLGRGDVVGVLGHRYAVAWGLTQG